MSSLTLNSVIVLRLIFSLSPLSLHSMLRLHSAFRESLNCHLLYEAFSYCFQADVSSPCLKRHILSVSSVALDGSTSPHFVYLFRPERLEMPWEQNQSLIDLCTFHGPNPGPFICIFCINFNIFKQSSFQYIPRSFFPTFTTPQRQHD